MHGSDILNNFIEYYFWQRVLHNNMNTNIGSKNVKLKSERERDLSPIVMHVQMSPPRKGIITNSDLEWK